MWKVILTFSSKTNDIFFYYENSKFLDGCMSCISRYKTEYKCTNATFFGRQVMKITLRFELLMFPFMAFIMTRIYVVHTKIQNGNIPKECPLVSLKAMKLWAFQKPWKSYVTCLGMSEAFKWSLKTGCNNNFPKTSKLSKLELELHGSTDRRCNQFLSGHVSCLSVTS